MNTGFWLSVGNYWGYWPWAIILPVYAYSQLRGDVAARGLAGALAIAALLGQLIASGQYPPVFPGSKPLGLDALLLGVQIAICLRSPRLYPIIIAAAQLVIVLTEAIAASGLAGRLPTLHVVCAAMSALQLSAFCYGLMRYRSRRPLWRIRNRPENPSAKLAPRANDAR